MRYVYLFITKGLQSQANPNHSMSLTNKRRYNEQRHYMQEALICDDLAYCPMCESLHENTTNCQRND